VFGAAVFGAADLALSCFGAKLFWRWTVLTLDCFCANAYLLDYHHAHIVASRTMFFPSLHGLSEEATNGMHVHLS